MNPLRLAKRVLRQVTIIGLMMPFVATIGIGLYFFAYDGDIRDHR